jgi:hypothetical protein
VRFTRPHVKRPIPERQWVLLPKLAQSFRLGRGRLLPLAAFGWWRGLWRRLWFGGSFRRRRAIKLGECGAERVEAWSVGEFVFCEGAPDGCGDFGEFLIGKIDRWHGQLVKTFDPALHGGLIAVRHVHHPDYY